MSPTIYKRGNIYWLQWVEDGKQHRESAHTSNKRVAQTFLGEKLYKFLVSVWSMYGIAAMMPANIKNVSYNLLDIVSKNFYGLYIYYKILQVHSAN